MSPTKLKLKDILSGIILLLERKTPPLHYCLIYIFWNMQMFAFGYYRNQRPCVDMTRLESKKTEEIWPSPITKTPTPTETLKKQIYNTKTPPKASITQRLRIKVSIARCLPLTCQAGYRVNNVNSLVTHEAKEKYRGVFEIQRSGDKTSSGEMGLDIRTYASPKVGQDQVSGGVSVLCWHAAPVA